MNQFMIRTNERVNDYYLYCYLSCRYGQDQLAQRITGAVPLSIDKESVRSVIVPLFGKVLQRKVEDLIETHLNKSLEAKFRYKEAQEFLLSELKLVNWQPKHQLTYVKNYSETLRAQRIDAEYYKPKYIEIVKCIKNNSDGWDTLGNLVSVRKCVEVGSGEYLYQGIPFVRVSNLSPFEITEEKYISEKLYIEIAQHQPKKGEILLSKDATPGIAYYLYENPQKIIPSSGILRLKSKTNKTNNEYLTLVLNSILVKEQVNRDVGGSVILHWLPDQVKETVIPILPEEKQTKLQHKIIKSFNLRKQSKHLLKYAKRAVEIAIEQDEVTALKWLKEHSE